jgi:hypothetical protein
MEIVIFCLWLEFFASNVSKLIGFANFFLNMAEGVFVNRVSHPFFSATEQQVLTVQSIWPLLSPARGFVKFAFSALSAHWSINVMALHLQVVDWPNLIIGFPNRKCNKSEKTSLSNGFFFDCPGENKC